MRLIVTGGAGFVGSNFIRHWFNQHPEDQITNLDALTYAGRVENLSDVMRTHTTQYRLVRADITDIRLVNEIIDEVKPEIVVNFAAETHTSLSIIDPTKFFVSNLMGTQTLLEACRQRHVPRFHQVSTGEIYHDAIDDAARNYDETTSYRPNNPYSASKAGADMAVAAYSKTFGLFTTTSVCCNNYGPFQYPEKLVPLFITRLLREQAIPVYRKSHSRREWLHVSDHCRALEAIIRFGTPAGIYNVGSGVEKSIDQIVDLLFAATGRPRNLLTYVDDRPGHDSRPLLNCAKVHAELNWSPKIAFEAGLQETVEWYRNNNAWWVPLKPSIKVKEDAWTRSE